MSNELNFGNFSTKRFSFIHNLKAGIHVCWKRRDLKPICIPDTSRFM